MCVPSQGSFFFRSRALTFALVAAVGLVRAVAAVRAAVAHGRAQQTATAVAHELLSGAALWRETHSRRRHACA